MAIGVGVGVGVEDEVRASPAVITGFHSVGSRSELVVWGAELGILADGGLLWTRVGVIGATIVRGESGGELGGVDRVFVIGIEGKDAERGLQESLRRQPSLQ